VKFDGDAKGLGSAAKQGEAHLSKFQKATGKLGEFGKKAASLIGGGLIAGAAALAAAGIGLGAVIAGNVGKALEQGAIKAKLAAQLGAAGPDAARLGKLAGKLYVDGYGESMGDTADMIKASFNQGLVSLKDTDEKIRDVVGSVSTYVTLTGEDAVAATRAVAQMLKTGLAKDGKEALDILTAATQKGVDKSGDLLDTVNEYSTQFRKLGLDGKDALGLINQMLQGGARDADTAADAIKEISIRAVDGSKDTIDAYESLGLNVAATTKAFGEGGESARKAFGKVLDGLNGITDPVERNRVGVELFGTKWEDLGAAIGKADLATAAGSLGDTAGAIDKANAALSNTPQAKLEKVWKQISQTVVDAIGKYIVPSLEKFADWFAGPGQYVAADWALTAAQALTSLAAWTSQILGQIIGTTIDFGLRMTDIFEKTIGKLPGHNKDDYEEAKKQIESYRAEVEKGFGAATGTLDQWNADIANMKDEVKLKADKADLDAKLKAAKKQLEDKSLTATKKAKLTADIAELTARRNEAQRQIDALHGKTVNVTLNTYKNLIETNIPGGSGVRVDGKRAAGGPVLAGRTYLVGENGPETVTMGANGNVTPNHELGGPTYLETHIHVGDEVVRVVRTELKQQNRNLKRTVRAGA
jgi:uncharacterized membrane-anchored protein YhcB (DUF1043 family)